MKRQLYILCDMEGASGISPANKEAMYYGSARWHNEGRRFITSDLKAVCEAANAFGVDQIVLNDSHNYGKREPNVLMSDLPPNVRLVRRPHLPGKARRLVCEEPFGIVIVGQHAMYGGRFAPHTIRSPPIGEVTLNDLRVDEFGLELALFMGARLLAIVGEAAAVDEANALCPSAVGVAVKSLAEDWFPPPNEMAPLIRERVLDALRRREERQGLHLAPPFRFSLRPTPAYRFDPNRRFFVDRLARWILLNRSHGRLTEHEATWTTQTIVGGLYALESSRGFLVKQSSA